jgi:hypothetical protein
MISTKASAATTTRRRTKAEAFMLKTIPASERCCQFLQQPQVALADVERKAHVCLDDNRSGAGVAMLTVGDSTRSRADRPAGAPWDLSAQLLNPQWLGTSEVLPSSSRKSRFTASVHAGWVTRGKQTDRRRAITCPWRLHRRATPCDEESPARGHGILALRRPHCLCLMQRRPAFPAGSSRCSSERAGYG